MHPPTYTAGTRPVGAYANEHVKVQPQMTTHSSNKAVFPVCYVHLCSVRVAATALRHTRLPTAPASILLHVEGKHMVNGLLCLTLASTRARVPKELVETWSYVEMVIQYPLPITAEQPVLCSESHNNPKFLISPTLVKSTAAEKCPFLLRRDKQEVPFS